MKKNFMISIWMTIATTILLGIVYPFVVTLLAQALFPSQANGSLITLNGKIVGSRLIGQPFSSPGYFRSRPSAAGTGYDAQNSGGSNLGPPERALGRHRSRPGIAAYRRGGGGFPGAARHRSRAARIFAAPDACAVQIPWQPCWFTRGHSRRRTTRFWPRHRE